MTELVRKLKNTTQTPDESCQRKGKEMKERTERWKGLLALLLCMALLAGNGTVVCAASDCKVNVREGQVLKEGDTITYERDAASATSSSGNLRVLYMAYEVSVDEDVKSINSGTLTTSATVKSQRLVDNTVVSKWKVALVTCTGSNAMVELEPYTGSAAGGTSSSGAAEEQTGARGKACEHSFQWEVIQEPTRTKDGVDANRCRLCGFIEETQPISYLQYLVKLYLNTVKSAAQGAAVTFDGGNLTCISDKMLAANAERGDVTMNIYFTSGEKQYLMTIPAGTDLSALLEDEEDFYGYYGLAARLGLTVTELAETK